MKKQKVDKSIVLAVVYGIVALEAVAMFMGIDGKLLTLVIGVLAGLAGLSLPQIKFK